MTRYKEPWAEEEPHMFLEPVAVPKIVLPFFDNRFFFRRQCVRILGIEGRKVRRIQLVRSGRETNRSLNRIDFIKEEPVFHVPLGMTENRLPFQFKKDDVDGLYDRLLAFLVIVVLVRRTWQSSAGKCRSRFPGFPSYDTARYCG
jgi:hypothetical protein